MQKELWQLAKPVIIKSFLFLILLPLGVLAIAFALAYLVGDKNPIWNISIAAATISIIWLVIGIKNFISIVNSSLNLSKTKARIFTIVMILIAIGVAALIDSIMGGGK